MDHDYSLPIDYSLNGGTRNKEKFSNDVSKPQQTSFKVVLNSEYDASGRRRSLLEALKDVGAKYEIRYESSSVDLAANPEGYTYRQFNNKRDFDPDCVSTESQTYVRYECCSDCDGCGISPVTPADGLSMVERSFLDNADVEMQRACCIVQNEQYKPIGSPPRYHHRYRSRFLDRMANIPRDHVPTPTTGEPCKQLNSMKRRVDFDVPEHQD